MGQICCNITNRLITGVISSEDPAPPEPASLWYALLTGIVWNGLDGVSIDGQGADVIFDDPALGNVMQGLFGDDTSGCWMITGTNEVVIWVYQSAQPNPVVINVGTGLPIDLTWTQGPQGLVSRCYEATVTVADPPNTAPYLLIISVNSFSLEFNVSGASFDNPAIATVLTNVFHQSFGANATLTVTDAGGGDYVIKILDTLIDPVRLDTTAAEVGIFANVPC